MSDVANFIQVDRILNDGEKVNAKVRPETININDIKGFRKWWKGKEEEGVGEQGKMTILMIKSTIPDKDTGGHKIQTIVINESYESFTQRLGRQTMIK